MNQCQLIGRLTRDPDFKTTPNGVAVAELNLAIPRRSSEECDFIRVICWRNTAEFVSQYFRKGQRMAVVGRIQTRSYEDKDRKKRTAFEVVAESVYFADGKGKAAEAEPQEGFVDVCDETLPF